MATRAIETLLADRLEPAARDWFARALVTARASGASSEAFGVAWSGLGRRLGRAVVVLTEQDRAALSAEGTSLSPQGWGADEVGRVLVLLAATEQLAGGDLVSTIEDLYRKGEMREQQAVLRALPHLPGPERFAFLAAEAVRSNVLSVLEALACENAYPAAHMPEPSFNQMVMKAIFNGLALRRVVGLASRLNPELRRMVGAYASERRAAGRPVPADVDLILGGPTADASL